MPLQGLFCAKTGKGLYLPDSTYLISSNSGFKLLLTLFSARFDQNSLFQTLKLFRESGSYRTGPTASQPYELLSSYERLDFHSTFLAVVPGHALVRITIGAL